MTPTGELGRLDAYMSKQGVFRATRNTMSIRTPFCVFYLSFCSICRVAAQHEIRRAVQVPSKGVQASKRPSVQETV